MINGSKSKKWMRDKCYQANFVCKEKPIICCSTSIMNNDIMDHDDYASFIYGLIHKQISYN